MGTLKRRGREDPIFLRSRCLIGRSSTCDVRIDDARISGEHAVVCWTGRAWELRDLASKNGTFVSGRKLPPGEQALLAAGDGFTLGGVAEPAERLALIDAAPPVASARNVASGVVRAAAGGLLVLPDEERARLSVVEGRDGRWTLEADGEVRPAVDREVVVVDGEAWSLDVPAPAGATLEASADRVSLETIALQFVVSRDEERVEVTVVHAGGEIQLPPRSHHYLLLTLARRRLADAEEQQANQGWMDRHDLCRMLAIDEHRLNVDIFRARKQLDTVGVLGAVNVIERRAGTGRMRLGVGRVAVSRTDR